MRKGNRFLSDRSIVMQSQTTRSGNGTMTGFFSLGLHRALAMTVFVLMAATAVTHTPVGDVDGPAGFEQYVADGDRVTLHWSLGGQLADQLDGLAILRFEQDMIAESAIAYGDLAPAEQVEVTPAAPEPCPPCREP